MSGTGCFIAVQIWQQWASEVSAISLIVLLMFVHLVSSFDFDISHTINISRVYSALQEH